jgi:phosphomannomutase
VFAKEKIKEEGADFGVIFDADGDRMMVVNEKAEVMRGDFIGGVIADNFLKKGDSLIYDIISTRAVRDYFENKGIKTMISKVGHYYIKKLMEANDVDFALEVSSHYYFKKMHYVESAFYALRLLLESLDKNPDKTISELAEPFIKYFDTGVLNFPLSSQDQWLKLLEDVKEKYKEGRQSFEDGILVEYDDFWFNLRPSNTEPVVRLFIEAKDEKVLNDVKKEVLALLK